MPANGTAGLARSAVSGISRLPSPPARTIASTFGRLRVMLANLVTIPSQVSRAIPVFSHVGLATSLSSDA